MFRIHLIAGARPNFMKVAPLYHAISQEPGMKAVLVHTGQHYSKELSDFIFKDLKLPEPDYQLGAGGGSATEQTAKILSAYGKILESDRPDLVVVVGDVNSTLACALAAKQARLPVAHLEAGLRSRDLTMPEELNRIVTDRISDYLWTPSPDGDENLLAEGVPASRIARVGNIMIDSFEMLRARIEAEPDPDLGDYAVVTLHRPSNVDDGSRLALLVRQIRELANRVPVVFPVHPRTQGSLEKFGLLSTLSSHAGVKLLPSLGYVEFMRLILSARVVVTDSGGIQEETSYLGIPCLTVRENTERPITVSRGTNRLIRADDICAQVEQVLVRSPVRAKPIEFWDGKTASRVMEQFKRIMNA